MTTNPYSDARNDLIFMLSDIHDDPSKCHSVIRSDGVLMRPAGRHGHSTGYFGRFGCANRYRSPTGAYRSCDRRDRAGTH